MRSEEHVRVYVRVSILPCPTPSISKANSPPPSKQVKQDGIARLNALSPAELRTELLRICGSTVWAERVARSFPHTTPTALLQAMEEVGVCAFNTEESYPSRSPTAHAGTKMYRLCLGFDTRLVACCPHRCGRRWGRRTTSRPLPRTRASATRPHSARFFCSSCITMYQKNMRVFCIDWTVMRLTQS